MSLTDGSIFVLGQDFRVLACLEEHVTDALGVRLGNIIYPLHECMCGRESDIDSASRLHEARAAVTITGDEVLVLRKLPRARISTPDSLVVSEEFAMAALIGNMGRVEFNALASRYQVEYFDYPAPGVHHIPDVDEMIDLNLGRYVIDCYEHPGLDLLRDPPAEEEYWSSTISGGSAIDAAGGWGS